MKVLKIALFVLIVTLFFACGSSETKQSELPVVDVTKSYPTKEIVLEDIADVEYIPLETRDDVLLGNSVSIALASQNKTILYDRKLGDVFVFNGQGKFLHKFNHQGQSGREYLRINKLVYDEASKNFYIYDNKQGGGKLQVYSETGDYKRSLPIGISEIGKIVNYDDKSLLAYEACFKFDLNILGDDDDKDEDKDNLTPFFFISKATGEKDTIDNFCLKNRESELLISSGKNNSFSIVMFTTSTIIPQKKEGVFVLNTFAGDTIFEYTREKNLKPICMKTPSLEKQGEKKILTDVMNVSGENIFIKLRPKDFGLKYKDYKNLVVDRYSGDIFTMQLRNADIQSDSVEVFTKTRLLQADKVVELLDENALQGKLKAIAEKLTADDNPVLVKVQLKK